MPYRVGGRIEPGARAEFQHHASALALSAALRARQKNRVVSHGVVLAIRCWMYHLKSQTMERDMFPQSNVYSNQMLCHTSILLPTRRVPPICMVCVNSCVQLIPKEQQQITTSLDLGGYAGPLLYPSCLWSFCGSLHFSSLSLSLSLSFRLSPSFVHHLLQRARTLSGKIVSGLSAALFLPRCPPCPQWRQ